jgi:F0F1-type ATP synthase assembly protein I
VISRPVKRFLLGQIFAVVALAVCSSLWLESQSALSVIVGAMIGLIALSYLAVQTFRFDPVSQPQMATRAFFRGVAGRFVLAVVLFAAAFVFMPWVQAPMLFLGFGVMLVTQVIGSVRLSGQLARDSK